MNNYLRVEDAFKSFGDINLLNKVTFWINQGDKVALIAKNGAGKSTLLNILTGKDSFDSGNLYLNKDIKVGYLEQDPHFDENLTLFQAVYGAPGELMETVAEYERSLHAHNEKKLEKAIAAMDYYQAWDLEIKIKNMLEVFKLSDHEQLVGKLSGGQVKRLALVVTLINDPDFLIMDEPTNHLDLEMIEWLEDYLTQSRVTLLMVTHDRYFLDRICNDIIEIDEKEIYFYAGNYSYYLQHHEERILSKVQTAGKAQNLLRKELEWMRRMPKARTTKARYRIDAFYDLQKQSHYRRNDKKVEMNVSTSRLGKKILVLDQITKHFGEKKILEHFSYTFIRKEKIGIIGPNGSGKTTFLNLVTGNLTPDSGKIEQGETVVYGYYQQQGLDFKPGRRVVDILKEIAEVVTLADGSQLSVTEFLNQFLFTPELQYVYVEKLSGGEKRRLYLMTLLMRNPNFLVLDEPTNDFDIVTLNVLEEYLSKFGGCVIIVSHDRFFMDKLVDHLFIFEGNGVVYDFPGNYSDYRASRKKQEIEEHRKELKIKPKTSNTVSRAHADSKKRKLSFKEIKELEMLSSEIELLEKEKVQLETEMSGGTLGHEDLLARSQRLGLLIQIIDTKSDRWLELSEIKESSEK